MRKKVLTFLMASAFLFSLTGCGDSGKKPVDPPNPPSENQITAEQLSVNESLAALSKEDFTFAQLCGTDALGRKVEPVSSVNDKYVGIFYFVCLGSDDHRAIYDISKLLDKYGGETEGNPLFALPNDAWYDDEISPHAAFHYWGEPLYGYYRSDDGWVVRRHLELFMQAGIDFIYLDYSNSTYEYTTAARTILNTILELQKEGYDNVPLVTFMLPNDESDSAAKVKSLYERWYKDPQYRSCWFRADKKMNPSGKPMVVGHFSKVTDKVIQKELWLKEMQWPTESPSDESFPWIEWNQAGTSQPNHGGIMNVSIAQHVNSWSSTSYTDSLAGGKKYKYRARGWTKDAADQYGTNRENVLAGTNFEFQWQNALAKKNDLDMVTVTGWNEWAAIKVDYGAGCGVFNDLFNMEFSRDAEMMKGGYGDNYYMQLARNVKKFKGESVVGSDNVALFGKVTANSASDVSVLPAAFCDIGADSVARNAFSVGGTYEYKDASNRNNVVEVRVGNDAENLYVAVVCENAITEQRSGGESWMNVYVSLGGGWNGYDFVIGRIRAEQEASIQKFAQDGTLKEAGKARYSVEGNTVLYSIPLASLNISSSAVIGIKATDNLQNFGNVDDFYVSGDSAPLGRLNYAYKIA